MNSRVALSNEAGGIRRALATGVVLALVVTAALPLAGAFAVTVANFEVDGNLIRESVVHDWASGPDAAEPGDRAGLISATRRSSPHPDTGNNCDQTSNGTAVIFCDDVKNDSTTYAGGTKEENPAGWQYSAGQLTPKTDITNVYAVGRVDGTAPIIINGMERLPKAGSVHLSFEYNKELDSNGNPLRRVNDIQVAYDMGGGRNSNENTILIRVFKAKDVGGGVINYDYAQADFEAEGTAAGSLGGGVTAFMNNGDVACGAWQCFNESGALTDTLPAFSFAEASINLSTAVGLSNVCVNYVTVKSRASTSVTSQLKDTTKGVPFPFCGGLSVQKYIDVNADGARTTTPDITAGNALLSGWSFEIKRGTTSICTGTTDNDGKLLICRDSSNATVDLASLPADTYSLIETQKTGYFSTDPGAGTPPVAGAPSTAANPTKTTSVTIGSSGSTVYFGNTCNIRFTFNVTGAPASPTLKAYYLISAGPGNGATWREVELAYAGTTWSGTTPAAANLVASNSLKWAYGTGSVSSGALPSDAIMVKDGDNDRVISLIGSGTPSSGGLCGASDSQAFAFSTVSGLKFEDLDSDGVRDKNASDVFTEHPLGGFGFELKDAAGVSFNPAKTTSSAADGTFSFGSIAPGTYRIYESTPPTGWSRTTPEYREVTVTLGSDPATQLFGNTPLSKVEVDFTSLAEMPNTSTKATAGSIECKKSNGGGAVVGSQSGNKYTATDLELKDSKIVCEITLSHTTHN